MKLESKFIGLSTGIPVAMLNKKTAEKIGVHTQERILIKTCSKKPKELVAIVEIMKGKLETKKAIRCRFGGGFSRMGSNSPR